MFYIIIYYFNIVSAMRVKLGPKVRHWVQRSGKQYACSVIILYLLTLLNLLWCVLTSFVCCILNQLLVHSYIL